MAVENTYDIVQVEPNVYIVLSFSHVCLWYGYYVQYAIVL
jgi:hypothetical protein